MACLRRAVIPRACLNVSFILSSATTARQSSARLARSTASGPAASKDAWNWCGALTGLRLEGWAVELERQEPAQMIVVFLDGQLLGYGASGVARLDVAQYLGAPSARYAGFRFEFA